jgi:hypothetical protein
VKIAQVVGVGEQDGVKIGEVTAGDAVVVTVREFFSVDGGEPTFGVSSSELRKFLGKRVVVIPIAEEGEPS